VRTRSLILLVLLVTLAFLEAAWPIVQFCLAADLTGRVVGIIDGDTIEVLRDQHLERIRLSDIYSPDKGQDGCSRSLSFTRILVASGCGFA